MHNVPVAEVALELKEDVAALETLVIAIEIEDVKGMSIPRERRLS